VAEIINWDPNDFYIDTENIWTTCDTLWNLAIESIWWRDLITYDPTVNPETCRVWVNIWKVWTNRLFPIDFEITWPNDLAVEYQLDPQPNGRNMQYNTTRLVATVSGWIWPYTLGNIWWTCTLWSDPTLVNWTDNGEIRYTAWNETVDCTVTGIVEDTTWKSTDIEFYVLWNWTLAIEQLLFELNSWKSYDEVVRILWWTPRYNLFDFDFNSDCVDHQWQSVNIYQRGNYTTLNVLWFDIPEWIVDVCTESFRIYDSTTPNRLESETVTLTINPNPDLEIINEQDIISETTDIIWTIVPWKPDYSITFNASACTVTNGWPTNSYDITYNWNTWTIIYNAPRVQSTCPVIWTVTDANNSIWSFTFNILPPQSLLIDPVASIPSWEESIIALVRWWNTPYNHIKLNDSCANPWYVTRVVQDNSDPDLYIVYYQAWINNSGSPCPATVEIRDNSNPQASWTFTFNVERHRTIVVNPDDTTVHPWDQSVLIWTMKWWKMNYVPTILTGDPLTTCSNQDLSWWSISVQAWTNILKYNAPYSVSATCNVRVQVGDEHWSNPWYITFMIIWENMSIQPITANQILNWCNTAPIKIADISNGNHDYDITQVNTTCWSAYYTLGWWNTDYVFYNPNYTTTNCDTYITVKDKLSWIKQGFSLHVNACIPPIELNNQVNQVDAWSTTKVADITWWTPPYTFFRIVEWNDKCSFDPNAIWQVNGTELTYKAPNDTCQVKIQIRDSHNPKSSAQMTVNIWQWQSTPLTISWPEYLQTWVEWTYVLGNTIPWNTYTATSPGWTCSAVTNFQFTCSFDTTWTKTITVQEQWTDNRTATKNVEIDNIATIPEYSTTVDVASVWNTVNITNIHTLWWCWINPNSSPYNFTFNNVTRTIQFSFNNPNNWIVPSANDCLATVKIDYTDNGNPQPTLDLWVNILKKIYKDINIPVWWTYGIKADWWFAPYSAQLVGGTTCWWSLSKTSWILEWESISYTNPQVPNCTATVRFIDNSWRSTVQDMRITITQ
jgi:hypothetical protein